MPQTVSSPLPALPREIGRLLSSEAGSSLCDCELRCTDGTLGAHWAILMAHGLNPTAGDPTSGGFLHIDAPTAETSAVLRYVYSGCIPEEKHDYPWSWSALVKASMSLGAEDLAAGCAKKYLSGTETIEFAHLLDSGVTLRMLQLMPSRRCLTRMLNHRASSDVVLRLPGEEVELHAHRAILLARSGFFESLFSRWSESRVTDLTELDFGSAVVTAVTYIYTDTIKLQVSSVEEVLAVLAAAGYLQIKSLELLCEQQLSRMVSMRSVCCLWGVSQEVGLEQLADEIVEFIQLNFRELASGTTDAEALLSEIPSGLMYRVLHPGRILGEARGVVDTVLRWGDLKCMERSMLDEFLPPNTLLTESWKLQVLQGSWSNIPNWMSLP